MSNRVALLVFRSLGHVRIPVLQGGQNKRFQRIDRLVSVREILMTLFLHCAADVGGNLRRSWKPTLWLTYLLNERVYTRCHLPNVMNHIIIVRIRLHTSSSFSSLPFSSPNKPSGRSLLVSLTPPGITP